MAGSSGAIRAGQAFVELLVNDNKLVRGLEQAKKKVQAFGSLMASVSARMAAVGGVGTAPFALAAKSAAFAGATIFDMAKRFGASTEFISKMGYAANATGGTLEDVGAAMEHLTDTVFEASRGDAGAIESLRQIGLTWQQLKGMSPEKQFEAVASAMERIPAANKVKGLELAFGGAGRALAPIFNQGRAGFDGLMSEAEKAGAVVSSEMAEKAKASSLVMSQAWATVQAVVMEVGFALLPTKASIGDLSAAISRAGSIAKKWITDNKDIIVVAAAVAGGLVVAAGGFYGLSIACSVAVPILVMTKMVLAGIMTILGFFLSPIGLVTAAIIAGGVAFFGFSESGQESMSQLEKYVSSTATTIRADLTTAWDGISASLKNGDFVGAAKIALNLLKLEWARGTLSMTQSWNTFKDYIVDTWHTVGYGLSYIWNEIWSGIKMVVVKACTHIVDTFLSALNSVASAANAINAKLGGSKDYWEEFKSDFGSGNGMAEQVEQDRRDEKKRIIDGRKDRLEAAHDARKESEKGARQDIRDAEEALKIGVKKAIEAGEAVNKEKEDWQGGHGEFDSGHRDSIASIPSSGQLAASARGAFQGPFASMLGIGDSVAKQTLVASERTANGIDQLNKQVGNLGGAKFK